MLKPGINEISNADYHADKNWMSSSAFKLIIKDHNEFHSKYILGNWPSEKFVPALQFGTAAHTLLLEPHLFDYSVKVYSGLSRRGKDWQDFLATHHDKIILTRPEMDKLQALKECYQNNSDAVSILEKCQYEHTMVASMFDLRLKARADGINLDKGYIFDVKTTGFSAEKDIFAVTARDLFYDLSAALYCLVAEHIYKKPFDFYFIVLSKSDISCRVFKSSKKFLLDGGDKLTFAFEKYKHFLLTGNYDYGTIEEEVQNGIEEI